MIDKMSLSPQKIASITQPKITNTSAAQVTEDFGSYLKDAVESLNTQQQQVDKLNTQFVKGEITDTHQLMIASEKASLGLELTVQVRNKVIEAYQEIMRMQM